MNKFLEIKKFYLFVFFFSILSLTSVLFVEYYLLYKPCKLCVYQRIPYLFAIFICFLGVNYSKNLLWIYCLFFIFFISSILSGYHVGIENNVFNEFSGCTKNNINIIDKEEIINSLNTTVQSCKNIEFKMLGLSLATINFIFSILICLLIIIVIKNEKNK